LINAFSYSAISTFQNCPLAFRFRYLDRKPEAFVTVETHMGRSVHGVLQFAYEAPGGPGSVTTERLESHYRELWSREDPARIHLAKRDKTPESYYQAGFNMILAFQSRVMATDQRQSLGLERNFSIELAGDTIFRGVVDRIARQADGLLRVIDYKTGRTGEPLDTLQLPSYALFAFSLTREDRLELCFEDLREGVTRTAIMRRDGIGEIRERLLDSIENIRRAADFPPRPSPLCRWCGFSPDCPGVAGMSPREPQAVTSEEPAEACPECGSPLARRQGRYGPFMGCSAYPRCRYTLDLSPPPEKLSGDLICPECGSPLRERKGKFGRFLGCSRYPACRFSRDLPEEKAKGVK